MSSKFTLSESFLEPYKSIVPPWDALGEFVYLRTYSRLIEEENRNENWWETVRRVVEGCFKIQKDHCDATRLPWNGRKAHKSAERMFDKIFNFKFSPPGRGLWMMGTRFVDERGSACLNNCFAGSEQFISDKGLTSFIDACGEKVKVLDGNREFVPAEIKSFGVQELNTYHFRPRGLRSNYAFTKEATPDHRWILADGTETTRLSIGDSIVSKVSTYDETDEEFTTGFAHGLVFGDGTRHTYHPERHFIRLCSERIKQHLPLLETTRGYVSTTCVEGDPAVTIVRKGENWKAVPEGQSYTYLAGFLKGWLTADATETVRGWKLASTNKEALEWAASHGAVLGWNIVGFSRWDNTEETNYGKRNKVVWGMSFTQEDVLYSVSEIEYGTSKEEVYCAVVPTTQSFHLSNGIPTGNCGFVSTEDISTQKSLPFAWMMDALMLGVGIGFDTKGADKLKIKQPSEHVETVTIPDSREGWVESLQTLLDSYFNGGSRVEFDYSLIRKYGEPIRGFGGTASGPAPLKKLHESARELLDKRVGTTLKSVDIVDLSNFIGVCVVAGNVRRSAEISLGDAEDSDFINMKNPDMHPSELSSHRWASNNSVFVQAGKTNYYTLAERARTNGEPGFVWLDNLRAYGRMKDGVTWDDALVKGVNPCSEQALESFELCTLVETYPSRHETYEDYEETLKYAYLYAKTVTLKATHWPETNQVMMKNRRIGTGQSGIIQAFERHGRSEMMNWNDKGYTYLRKVDAVYSDWLCVPRSKKVTTVKPSGTVSLLAGVTPGIHYPHSEYYLRRVRLPSSSPLIKPLEAAGFPIEDCAYGGKDNNTSVVTFPEKSEHFDRCKKDVSLWEQVKNVADYQYWWSDNAVSCTVTFNPEREGDDIARVLQSFDRQLKAISFLPDDGGGHKQAVYEEIDKKTYENLTANLKRPDFSFVTSPPEGERFCDGEACTL